MNLLWYIIVGIFSSTIPLSSLLETVGLERYYIIKESILYGCNPYGPDVDNNGINDCYEWEMEKVFQKTVVNGLDMYDTDGDGISNYLDQDDDGDGVPDKLELLYGVFPKDSDGDGIPDHKDQDDDGDGILTKSELGNRDAFQDTDGDSVPDYLDEDDDGDGLLTKIEISENPLTQYKDISLNQLQQDQKKMDKIKDALDKEQNILEKKIEKQILQMLMIKDPKEQLLAQEDIQKDQASLKEVHLQQSKINIDLSRNAQIYKEINASLPDSDGDGIPDYKDVDDDNDGIPTKQELSTGKGDSDRDGVPDYLDKHEGINNNQDSDGDGIPDYIECFRDACPDSDRDGVSDYLDTDSDNDGIIDTNEFGNIQEQANDTDGDGIPDYRDPDDDNDGVSTKEELGNTGIPILIDNDNDSRPHYRDNNETNTTPNFMLSGSGYVLLSGGSDVSLPLSSSCMNLDGGADILDGQVISVYKDEVVYYPETCISETKTCNNGSRRGTSSLARTCRVIALDCKGPDNNRYPHLSVATFYKFDYIFGKQSDGQDICQRESRQCIGGIWKTLAGIPSKFSYKYKKCLVVSPD